MNTIHYIILSGIVIASLSMSGLAVIKSSKKITNFVEKNLMSLSALSAGVFLVTSFLLIRETLELLPLHWALVAFGIGALVYYFLHKVFNHHRHGEDHEHHHNDKQSAWKILIGDTLHNIANGLLLVSSFGFGVNIGLSNALSIALHEIPQEISEFIVLRKSGFSNTEAIYRNVATALSIFVGIGLGLALITTEGIQAYMLGATATFFLGIVFTDLFPLKQIVKSPKRNEMISALLLGILFMTSVTQVLGHSHAGEHNHDHEEHSDIHTEDEHHLDIDDHLHEEIHNH